MGLICKEEKRIPQTSTSNAVLLYPHEFERNPKHSQTTKAAAIGAVMAEVTPAAKKPSDNNTGAKSPYRGAKAKPKSVAD